MSGSYNRQKGHSFERELAKEFQELGFDCMTSRNGDRSQDARGRDLVDTWPYAVQAKRYKNYVPINTIEEIEVDDGEIALLITKANNKPAMAVLPWHDLKKLIRKSALPHGPDDLT